MLKIDREFSGQIPPLTDEEFAQLEENILFDGKQYNAEKMTIPFHGNQHTLGNESGHGQNDHDQNIRVMLFGSETGYESGGDGHA